MKTGNIRLLCGGRNNGKTTQQYLDIQKWAVENGYEKVKVEFITPDIIKIQELIDYLKEQIDLQTEITKNSKSFRSTKYQIAISLRLLCQEILSKIEKE